MGISVSTLVTDLGSKLHSLSADLKHWEELALEDDSPFARHQSQIVRLRNLFRGMEGELSDETKRIAVLPLDDAFPAAKKCSARMLEAHSLWSFFRNKLLLRCDKSLSRYLRAADEFAWACFQSFSVARANAAGADPACEEPVSKVPPLIYLGREISPLVYPLDWSLEDQAEEAGVSDELFSAVVERAPFSVLSMPFFQTKQMSGSMILAHEMGHVVEMDLKLSGVLDAALKDTLSKRGAVDSSLATRLDAWAQCRVEAFADVFGSVISGTAFCRALADFLATDEKSVVEEELKLDSEYSYPTRYLRVLLAVEVHRREDGSLPEAVAEIAAEWRLTYRSHRCADYEDDLPSVVAALADYPHKCLGEKSIRQIKAFSGEAETRAQRDAKKMRNLGVSPKATDPIGLLAAAALAERGATMDQRAEIERLTLDHVEKVSDDAPRSAAEVGPEVKLTDSERGVELASLLGSPVRRSREP